MFIFLPQRRESPGDRKRFVRTGMEQDSGRAKRVFRVKDVDGLEFEDGPVVGGCEGGGAGEED